MKTISYKQEMEPPQGFCGQEGPLGSCSVSEIPLENVSVDLVGLLWSGIIYLLSNEGFLHFMVKMVAGTLFEEFFSFS